MYPNIPISISHSNSENQSKRENLEISKGGWVGGTFSLKEQARREWNDTYNVERKRENKTKPPNQNSVSGEIMLQM